MVCRAREGDCRLVQVPHRLEAVADYKLVLVEHRLEVVHKLVVAEEQELHILYEHQICPRGCLHCWAWDSP